MTLPNLEPLTTEQTTRGADPDALGDEYMTIVKRHIDAAPRSLQTRIGPSELGHPCTRRIAYKLLGHDERQRQPAWRATVGTAVHTWLEGAFDADNLTNPLAAAGEERWYVETRVSVGEVGGVDITGSCDLYDRVTATVIDHKTVGPTKLKDYRANGPGEQYRDQAHLYGRGCVRAGLPVDTVMIAFLPRNGELNDAYLWHEPYNEQIALNALQRADGIALAVNQLGTDVLQQLPTVDAYCGFCPYHRTNPTDLTEGCPGHPRSTAAANPFSDLLAG